MKTLDVALTPHLWDNNRMSDLSCTFFTLSKILKPEELERCILSEVRASLAWLS